MQGSLTKYLLISFLLVGCAASDNPIILHWRLPNMAAAGLIDADGNLPTILFTDRNVETYGCLNADDIVAVKNAIAHITPSPEKALTIARAMGIEEPELRSRETMENIHKVSEDLGDVIFKILRNHHH